MGLAAQGAAIGGLAALAAVLQGCGSSSPAPSPSPAPGPPANPSVRLANGVMMPLVSAGTWQYNDSQAAATVEAALAVGYTHIDTAFDYNNQAGVGTGLKASGKARGEVFITSKVPGCGLQGVKDCYKDTARIIREDIRLLGSTGYPAEYLDLILIHFPPCKGESVLQCAANHTGCDPDKCEQVQDQWRALTEAYEAKLVRAVGVSNYCSGCFKCLEGWSVKPMVNQVQLHVGMGADPQGFVSFAQKWGTVLQAWSPLGSGGHGDSEILTGGLTTGIAAAHQKTAAQVALKWILAHNVTLSTKSSSRKHLTENLGLFDFELTAEEMQKLDAADFHKADNPSFMCRDASPAAYADMVI